MPTERRDIEPLRAHERETKKQLDGLEKRRKRIWEIAEEGDLRGSHVRERLNDLDEQRDTLQAQLERTRVAIAEAQRLAAASQSVAALIANLQEAWKHASTEQRQEIAKAVSALTAVSGLFADPARKHELIVGADLVAKQPITDASRMVATSVLVGNLVRAFSMTP